MRETNEQLEEMTFWEHIDVLRRILLRMAIVILIFAIGLFVFMPWIFDNIILAPTKGDFFTYQLFENISGNIIPGLSSEDFNIKLINIELSSQFFIHMSTSCWLAIVLAFPFLIAMLWGFISPALYNEEKRGLKRAFAFGNIMFYLGVAVGYLLVFPITMRFLAEYQISELVPNIISLDSYMNNFIMICLMMGIIFELPLLAWLLGKMKLLTKSFFKRYRRHAIVALLILAAIVTPTGDPFTLCIVFIPIYTLWEFSAYLVPKKQEIEQSI